MYPIVCIFFLFGYTRALTFDGCDNSRILNKDNVFYIHNSNYPNNNTGKLECRWNATCPQGDRCKLDCNIQIPETESCSNASFLISKTDDPQLTTAERYCGRKNNISVVSTGVNFTFGVISPPSTTGVNYMCKLTTNAGTCTCGSRNVNLTGGSEQTSQATKPNDYHMYVSIQRGSSHICGGAIISKNHIITGASCIINGQISNLAVMVGNQNISAGNDSTTTKFYKINSTSVHPNYTKNGLYDVALIKVNGEIIFNEFISPMCLPLKYISSDFDNQNVTVPKWSLLTGGAALLNRTVMTVVDQSTCQKSVSNLTSSQICTVNARTGTCNGDIGSPLIYSDQSSGSLILVGLRSRTSCDERGLRVNTRLTAILGWIVDNTQVNYCYK